MSAPDDMKAFNRATIDEFRANNGVLTDERLRAAKVVLLTTTGSKTGRQHTVPLGDFSDQDDKVLLWASARGAPKHPAWYSNLVASPAVVVERKGANGNLVRVESTAVTINGADRERAYALLLQSYPEAAGHQAQTDREIPIVLIEV